MAKKSSFFDRLTGGNQFDDSFDSFDEEEREETPLALKEQ